MEEDFGQWLYERRKEKNLTELELVQKIDMKQVQEKNIKKWERDLEFPDIDMIYKLSEIYMIPSAEIIERKNRTLQKGVGGVHKRIIAMISLAMGISIYGTIWLCRIVLGLGLVIAFYMMWAAGEMARMSM